MNEEMIDLSHRVVACKSWRWLPGMRASWIGMDTGWRILSHSDSWYEAEGIRDSLPGGPTNLPDLTDPATIGCLLVLVREVWEDPTASTAATREADGKRGWVMDCWDPKSPLNGIGPFQSEAEALVAALEVAP